MLEGKVIKIEYENGEHLELTIVAINASEIEVSYKENGQQWVEKLTKYNEVISFDKRETITLNTNNVTDHKATCAGQYVTKSKDFSYGICFSQSNETPETATDQAIVASSADENNTFNVTLDNLPSGVTFYYRSFLTVNDQTYYGEVKTFATIDVTTKEATDIEDKQAVCSGQYYKEAFIKEYGIWYSDKNGIPDANGTKMTATSADEEDNYSLAIKQLLPATTYYFCAYVINMEGKVFYSEIESFKIIGVKTLGYDKTKETATCSGEYIGNSQNLSEYGICYSTSSQSPTTSNEKVVSSNMSAEGIFSATISNLKSEITYYYRDYSIVGSKTYYGETKSFKVERSFPVGTWKQTILEVTEIYGGEEHYSSGERNFIIVYLESGKIGTVNASGELIIDEKSSYSYDETTQTLSSSYYDAGDKQINTETGKVTFTDSGFKLTIKTTDEHVERIAITIYLKQSDAPGTN